MFLPEVGSSRTRTLSLNTEDTIDDIEVRVFYYETWTICKLIMDKLLIEVFRHTHTTLYTCVF